MEKHIDVEEMIQYLTCTKLDKESMALAQRVNAHLLRCKECRKIYDTVHGFYDVAFNCDRDRDLFRQFSDMAMLVKFKIINRISLCAEYATNSIHHYGNPQYVGARGGTPAGDMDGGCLVDEENSLNSVRIVDNDCMIQIDKEEWGEEHPVLLAANQNGEIVFSGVMDDAGEQYQIKMPMTESEYSVYVTKQGD